MQATLPKKWSQYVVPGPPRQCIKIYFQENGVHDFLREDIRRPCFMQSNALSGNKRIIHSKVSLFCHIEVMDDEVDIAFITYCGLIDSERKISTAQMSSVIPFLCSAYVYKYRYSQLQGCSKKLDIVIRPHCVIYPLLHIHYFKLLWHAYGHMQPYQSCPIGCYGPEQLTWK